MYCNKCGNYVDINAKFCNRCGNSLQPIIPQNNIPVNNQESKGLSRDKKGILIGIGIGVLVLLMVFLFIGIFGGSSDDYYFDNNSNSNNNPQVVNNDTSTSKNKYQTVIITDNRYTGVKINGKEDAIEAIVEDSVKQKGKCPKDIKEVEERIIKNYGIPAVNLCEMDLDFALEVENVFKTIYEEYPSIRGYLTNLTLINASMRDSYIAAFQPFFNFVDTNTVDVYKMQVLLNTKYFLNATKMEKSVIASSEAGHFPPNTTRYSPVAHELGHYISFLAMMKSHKIDSTLLVDGYNRSEIVSLVDDFSKGNFSLLMIKEAYENYKKDTGEDIELDAWRGTISQYALAKNNEGNYIYDETIAESFHDVYLNKDKAAPASRYVIAVLKEKLGDK